MTYHETPSVGFKVRRTSPLEWLWNRRSDYPWLTEARYLVAKQYERDYYAMFSEAQPTSTNWNNVLDGVRIKGACPGEVVPFHWFKNGASNRFERITKWLGKDLGNVAVRIICLEHSLVDLEKEMGWCARSGKVVFSIALTQMAEFYAEELGAKK